MGRGNVQNVALQRGELGHRTRDSSSALLADLQRATNDIKVRVGGGVTRQLAFKAIIKFLRPRKQKTV